MEQVSSEDMLHGETVGLTIVYDIENKEKRWPELISVHRFCHVWFKRGREKLRIDEKGTELEIPKVHAMIVDALRSLYFPMEPRKNDELDKLSAKYEKTSPPKDKEERKQWDRTRRELFEKGKIVSRRLEVDIKELSDRDLLLKHSGLHDVYNRLRSGERVLDWTEEEVIKCHVLTEREMRRRELEHSEIDELDRRSKEMEYPEPSIMEKLPSWKEIPLDEITPDYLICLSESDLINLYKRVHKEFQEKGKVTEDLYNANVFIGNEMIQRGIYWENRIDDELTRKTQYEFIEYPPPRLEGEYLTLEEFLKSLPEEFEVDFPAHIYVSGRIVNLGKVKRPLQAMRPEHDIDIIVMQPYFDRRLIHALVKKLPPEIAKGCHFVFSPEGPSIGYTIPLYNRAYVLSKKHPRLSPWEIIPHTAYLAAKEVEWGRMLTPCKPKSGLLKYEWWKTEDAWNNWAKDRLAKKGALCVSHKWDGRRFVVAADKEKHWAKAWTEDQKRDRSKELWPILEELLEKMRAKRVMLDGDLCAYDTGGKKVKRAIDKVRIGTLVPREDTAAFTVGEIPKELLDKAVFACYEILWVDDRPVNLEGIVERKKLIHQVLPEDMEHWLPTPFYLVHSKKEFFDTVRKVRSEYGSEGAIIADPDMVYPAKYTGENRSSDFIKIKNLKEIDVMVIERVEKKTKEGKPLGTYMYTCYYEIPEERKDEFYDAKKWDDMWLAPIGTAYGRKLDLKPGTIVTVVPIRIRKYEREGKTLYTWMFPNILEVKHNKTRPDPLTTVEKLARLGTGPLPGTLEEDIRASELAECPFSEHVQICPLRTRFARLEELRFPIKCPLAYEYRCPYVKSYYYASEEELKEVELSEVEEEE